MNWISSAGEYPTQNSVLARVFDVLERAAGAADRLGAECADKGPADVAQSNGQSNVVPRLAATEDGQGTHADAE
jgi:hypothetical protein